MKKKWVEEFFLGFTMCKTGKKINFFLINLFGSTGFFFFFRGFPVVGMRKKNDVNKKKKKQKLEWATTHLVVESRYTVLYRDRHGLGAPGGTTRPRGCAGAHSGTPRYGQLGYDTAGLLARRAASASA